MAASAYQSFVGSFIYGEGDGRVWRRLYCVKAYQYLTTLFASDRVIFYVNSTLIGTNLSLSLSVFEIDQYIDVSKIVIYTLQNFGFPGKLINSLFIN